jgi:hypothetical protein
MLAEHCGDLSISRELATACGGKLSLELAPFFSR